MPYLSHDDTYVRFTIFASSESSQIWHFSKQTDTNRLSYMREVRGVSYKAKDLWYAPKTHKHCYYCIIIIIIIIIVAVASNDRSKLPYYKTDI